MQISRFEFQLMYHLFSYLSPLTLRLAQQLNPLFKNVWVKFARLNNKLAVPKLRVREFLV